MRLFDGDTKKQYFIFTLGKRYFGVPIGVVVKVISISKVYSAPLLSEYFMGFVLHEKRPVPLMSLKRRIGLSGDDGVSMALIVRHEEDNFGFSIDGDYQVVQIEQEPSPIPSDFTGVVKKFFTARGALNDKNFIILNIDALAESD